MMMKCRREQGALMSTQLDNSLDSRHELRRGTLEPSAGRVGWTYTLQYLRRQGTSTHSKMGNTSRYMLDAAVKARIVCVNLRVS